MSIRNRNVGSRSKCWMMDSYHEFLSGYRLLIPCHDFPFRIPILGPGYKELDPGYKDLDSENKDLITTARSEATKKHVFLFSYFFEESGPGN